MYILFKYSLIFILIRNMNIGVIVTGITWLSNWEHQNVCYHKMGIYRKSFRIFLMFEFQKIFHWN